ncbi:MAG: hypothetical protein IKU11_07950, partial [Clostridia bacterium]|nr:hypothetical protein [Clostridia bacterium]
MKLLHRNRHSKRGSSLPMVMAIGAALVIWVMALLPLMATSGTTAAQTKLLEANYISSKSSIEFVKGELTEMVKKQGLPSTFAAVIDETATNGAATTFGGDIYKSIPKYLNGGSSTNDVYFNYVADNVVYDDKDDTPNMSGQGSKVTAICSVTLNESNYSRYDITITTWENGNPGITYTATYTVSGQLKIFPEAYKQEDALPLSD